MNLTQESFDRLLAWLDPDREQAGHKYERIRQKLIRYFQVKGCLNPEDLADETITRVANMLGTNPNLSSVPPLQYFYGVARLVAMEFLRKQKGAA